MRVLLIFLIKKRFGKILLGNVLLFFMPVFLSANAGNNVQGFTDIDSSLGRENFHLLNFGASYAQLSESEEPGDLTAQSVNIVPLSEKTYLVHLLQLRSYNQIDEEIFPDTLVNVRQLWSVQTDRWGFLFSWKNFSNQSFSHLENSNWAVAGKVSFFEQGHHRFGISLGIISEMQIYGGKAGPFVFPSYIYNNDKFIFELGIRSRLLWRWTSWASLSMVYMLPAQFSLKNRMRLAKFLILTTDYHRKFHSIDYFSDQESRQYTFTEQLISQEIAIPFPPAFLLYVKGEYRFSGNLYTSEDTLSVLRGEYTNKKKLNREVFLGFGVKIVLHKFFTKKEES